MYSKTTIHGYFGRDPELDYRDGQNGKYAHVTFSVGVSRNRSEETDWYFCVMNGKRAEVIDKWFSKGSQIVVEGRMESYPDKDNPKRKNWILVVTDFDFCDSSGKSKGNGNQNEPVQADGWSEFDDDNPFE